MKNSFLKGLAFFGLLAGCNPDDPVFLVDTSVLKAAYITDWAPYEAFAGFLRDSDARYTTQSFNVGWIWDAATISRVFYGIYHDVYSLKHGRVEYAHAAGLTGSGQLISVVDNGFLIFHDEFAGKNLYAPGGIIPPVADHGTGVASVAAGSALSGNMIGVAPGADIAFGVFTNWNTLRDANVLAENLNAVAQNNSWGYPTLDATKSDFDSLFASNASVNYLDSLKSLSNDTVLVFAADNDETRGRIDLMAGLPLLVPSLEKTWITVVNAVPVFNGQNITSATVISSNCWDAAAFCMAADGTVYLADAGHNSSYGFNTGTSFSAPQVTGGIAILAEAFPQLNATELRVRMLASADNSFYNHNGYVEFAEGIRHGYNSEFGHGFMNLKAALSPIGGSYVPRSNGNATPLQEATVASTGMAGDVVTRGLQNHDLATVDGLGAGFDVPASLLTADVAHRYDPLATIEDLFSAPMSGDSFAPQDREYLFAAVDTGQQVDFETDGAALSLLLPADGDSSFGVALSHSVDAGTGTLEFGISAIQESSGFVGIKSLLKGDSLGAVHGGVSMAYNAPLGRDQMLTLSGQFGVATANGSLTDMDLSSAHYNSLGLSYNAANVFGSNDRLALGLSMPNAIQSGNADVTLPSARSDGGVDFTTLAVPLTATARQLDISASYGFGLFDGSDVIVSAVRSLNDGNISGNNTTEAGIGFRFNF